MSLGRLSAPRITCEMRKTTHKIGTVVKKDFKDICYVHLQTPSSKKHYILCEPEFGIENQVKVTLIRHAFMTVNLQI